MTAPYPSLEVMQGWMLDVITAPERIDRAVAEERFLPGPSLDAGACLAIYQRSYILRLRKCLAGQFPATLYALGDRVFEEFADAYLRACPSDSYTLDALGRRFADWLDETRFDRDLPPDEREDWVDFLVDLARYERELFVLYDAPGVESGLPPHLRWPDLDTDDARLMLRPGLLLVQYRHAVAWYYHEVRAGREPGFPRPSPMQAVVVRHDYETTTYPMSAFHFRFLETVRVHGTVAAALADLADGSGRSLDEITRSWMNEVRRPWIEAAFFVTSV